MTNSEHAHERSRGHYQPSRLVMALLVMGFALCVFLMVRSTTPGSSSVLSPTGSSTTTTATVTRAQVRVQVANGTTIAHLARNSTQNLMTQGWNTLPELNGPAVGGTVIYYNPGYAWAARDIAQELNVASSAVQPLSGLNPVAGASSDDVIVILGPDAANQG